MWCTLTPSSRVQQSPAWAHPQHAPPAVHCQHAYDRGSRLVHCRNAGIALTKFSSRAQRKPAPWRHRERGCGTSSAIAEDATPIHNPQGAIVGTMNKNSAASCDTALRTSQIWKQFGFDLDCPSTDSCMTENSKNNAYSARFLTAANNSRVLVKCAGWFVVWPCHICACTCVLGYVFSGLCLTCGHQCYKRDAVTSYDGHN